jgi:hypothetical protein
LTCYEAGPFGYGLHRELTALGTTNYVIRPRDWDEYGQKVKTDRRDARRLVLELDRYVAGNHAAFCVVRVPTLTGATQARTPAPLPPAESPAPLEAAGGKERRAKRHE